MRSAVEEMLSGGLAVTGHAQPLPPVATGREAHELFDLVTLKRVILKEDTLTLQDVIALCRASATEVPRPDLHGTVAALAALHECIDGLRRAVATVIQEVQASSPSTRPGSANCVGESPGRRLCAVTATSA
jgi:hypothetical protein